MLSRKDRYLALFLSYTGILILSIYKRPCVESFCSVDSTLSTSIMAVSSEPPLKPLHPFNKVIIIGAGPSGLLLALLLAQHKVPVLVLEGWSVLDSRLRATQYGTPASRIFRKAGVLDDIRAAGMTNFKGICWRKASDGEKLASVDLTITKDDPDRITVLPLGEILKILYRHCQDLGIDVRFEHRVSKVGQDEKKAWVEAEIGLGGDGEKRIERFEADYVVGCDGASSTVRQELFGKDWPGVTWPHVLMVQNVSFNHRRQPRRVDQIAQQACLFDLNLPQPTTYSKQLQCQSKRRIFRAQILHVADKSAGRFLLMVSQSTDGVVVIT